VAHRLYHDFGFTDMSPYREWSCPLAGHAASQPPTGVVFREYKAGEGERASAFVLETLGKTFHGRELSFGELPPEMMGYLAERDRKLVGMGALAYEGGEEAQLRTLALAKDGQQAAIADSLLALLHRAAREAGAKVMKCFCAGEIEEVVAALHRAGYVSRLTGGVWMMQVRHLDQFLHEIAPAIEERLAKSEFKSWEGKLDLVGGRLRARVIVSRGRVTASRPVATPGDIVVTCDDETLTRIALGRETAFEAYLQSRLNIAPRVNDTIVKLLETVFPKVLMW
jgi:putative sterol carrier protein